MSLDPRTPVLVGAGQVLHRAAGVDDALEPAELMSRAARQAFTDAGLGGGPSNVDALRVVNLFSWRYHDPARYVAERMGIDPGRTGHVIGGGNSPQALVNSTAAQIQRGELDLVVLAGGESWRSRMRSRKLGVDLPWTPVPDGVEPDEVLGSDLDMTHPAELERGVAMPVQVYPMLESALRARSGDDVDKHLVRISELWAGFSAVAARNPNAWLRDELSAEQVRTTGPSNRMIGLPYPKYMNSNNDVDMAAALVMCSVERARSLGVPDDRWVFLHSGTDANEHRYLSHRWSLTETPAIELAGRMALDLAGLGVDDLEVIDLYSCFPSAVQLGARSLGLSLDRQLTRTGGLSFAGGPWNNYVMHAIATVMDDLRERPGEAGLVWGNGGFVTKHSFGIYSTRPPAAGFRHGSPQVEVDALARREHAMVTDHGVGSRVEVEAYTVMHDRDGAPETAIVSCLLADGRRAWATSGDRDLAGAMCEGEWVGRSILLDGQGSFAPA